MYNKLIKVISIKYNINLCISTELLIILFNFLYYMLISKKGIRSVEYSLEIVTLCFYDIIP